MNGVFLTCLKYRQKFCHLHNYYAKNKGKLEFYMLYLTDLGESSISAVGRAFPPKRTLCGYKNCRAETHNEYTTKTGCEAR